MALSAFPGHFHTDGAATPPSLLTGSRLFCLMLLETQLLCPRRRRGAMGQLEGSRGSLLGWGRLGTLMRPLRAPDAGMAGLVRVPTMGCQLNS